MTKEEKWHRTSKRKRRKHHKRKRQQRKWHKFQKAAFETLRDVAVVVLTSRFPVKPVL